MVDTITVIIPTLAARPKELERAILSVTSQIGIKTIPLVVLNGDRYDVDLVGSLRRRSDIRFLQIEVSSVSKARLAGRQKVDTRYFAFLDDDDELLPEAMTIRTAALARQGTDLVVTNGFRQIGNHRSIIFPRFDQEMTDHARALLDENWLASAGGLFRTDTVDESHFSNLPDFLEMTFLAFKMAHEFNIIRLNQPTFVIHSGAGDQASKSWRYYQEVPRVLGQMRRFTSRNDLLSQLRKKEVAALHEASTKALERNDRESAWKYHLRSLTMIHGLRYIPYTRHIVLARNQT